MFQKRICTITMLLIIEVIFIKLSRHILQSAKIWLVATQHFLIFLKWSGLNNLIFWYREHNWRRCPCDDSRRGQWQRENKKKAENCPWQRAENDWFYHQCYSTCQKDKAGPAYSVSFPVLYILDIKMSRKRLELLCNRSLEGFRASSIKFWNGMRRWLQQSNA